MATTYEWHLGFDFDSLPDIANGNRFYVQNGFVRITDDSKRVPSTPFGLNVGDMISFKVFNVTTGATASDFSITDGEIVYAKAETTDGSAAPFDGLPTINGLPTMVIPAMAASVASQEVSAIFSGLAQEVQFQVWGVPGSTEVAHDGKFFFTVTLNIQKVGEDTPRLFRVDPG
ncbi:MAG: hypothetical protein WAM82_12675 [Thermoanaerobaculia bacterium]